MSVPPGMGAGYGGRTTGIICQEDTGQKEVVRESLCATVVSGYRLSTMQSLTGLWPRPCLLSRTQGHPEGLIRKEDLVRRL